MDGNARNPLYRHPLIKVLLKLNMQTLPGILTRSVPRLDQSVPTFLWLLITQVL